MDLELSFSPPPIEVTLAARRAKRQAILAKYAGVASVDVSPSPGPGVVQPPPTSFHPDVVTQSHDLAIVPETDIQQNGASSSFSFFFRFDLQISLTPYFTGKRESMSRSPTPADFALAKDGEAEDAQAKVQAQNTGTEQVSAADYDPSLDRREDEQRRVRGVDDAAVPNNVETIEEVEEEEEEVDDMFAVAMGQRKKVRKVKKITVSAHDRYILIIITNLDVKKPVAPALITTTLDSAADHEGYYQVILGEQLDGGRYQVFSSLGKGMFANVVRARVLQGEPGEEVAIKIIRCQESMFVSPLVYAS
jgi:serine/threonine-protein kinase PRP4